MWVMHRPAWHPAHHPSHKFPISIRPRHNLSSARGHIPPEHRIRHIEWLGLEGTSRMMKLNPPAAGRATNSAFNTIPSCPGLPSREMCLTNSLSPSCGFGNALNYSHMLSKGRPPPAPCTHTHSPGTSSAPGASRDLGIWGFGGSCGAMMAVPLVGAGGSTCSICIFVAPCFGSHQSLVVSLFLLLFFFSLPHN